MLTNGVDGGNSGTGAVSEAGHNMTITFPQISTNANLIAADIMPTNSAPVTANQRDYNVALDVKLGTMATSIANNSATGAANTAGIIALSNFVVSTSFRPYVSTTIGSNNILLANGYWQIFAPTGNATYYPPTGVVDVAICFRADVCTGTNTIVIATNGFCIVYPCTNPVVTLYPNATNRFLFEKPYGDVNYILMQEPKTP
jgi:hypothetical protein